MSLSDKFGKLKSAAADLMREVVDEVGDKLVPDIDPPPMNAPASGWRPIAEASVLVRDLARASIGGELRFARDLTSSNRGGYAFWVVGGVVTDFFEIPPRSGR